MDRGERAPETADRLELPDEEWRRRLTPQQYDVMRRRATEPPFTGLHLRTRGPGTFLCAGCGNPLFAAGDKYDSGSGWPSFTRPLAEASLRRERDTSHGLVRVEVLCRRCDAHLGHVFPDGPPPDGVRYCINSASLDFAPADGD